MEVSFELRPGVVDSITPIPFKDGGWKDARELDGRQYLVDYLLGCVGRQLRDGLYKTILEVIEIFFGQFVKIPTLGPPVLHGRLFRWCHAAIIGLQGVKDDLRIVGRTEGLNPHPATW